MKFWKKVSALGLALALTLSLAACGKEEKPAPEAEQPPVQEEQQEQPSQSPAEDVVTRVAALRGPTGMGMAYLTQDEAGAETDRYTISVLAAPTDVPAMLAKGEVDLACVPANMASVLYQKMEGNVVNLAINTLGVLYVVENGDTVESMADLKGKTLVASGKGATPEYALRYLLTENGIDPDKDVSIQWKNEHSECVAAIATNAATIAMLPQPFVTVAQGKVLDLRLALDLTEEWNKLDNGSQLITGVVVARKDFVEQHPDAVETFLQDYARSVEQVNADPDTAGIRIGELGIVDAAMAQAAIPTCNIVCLTGSEMQKALSGYLQVLLDASPESVGGALPGEDFYYGA